MSNNSSTLGTESIGKPTGIDIKEHHVKRAIDLAMKKYCSASAQMAALANIKTSYEIIEADTP